MSIRKNKAFTLSFAAIDPTNRPQRKSGVTFSAGNSQLSKDGASFANTTNLPAEIGSTGRYSLVLTAAELDCDHAHIKVTNASIDDVDLVYATGGQPSGTVVTDGGNTASTFKTDLSEGTDDYWKDALLLFTSGALAGQVKKITTYSGTTKFVTLSAALTGTPSSGDRFVLINL